MHFVLWSKREKNPCGAISGTLYIPIHLSNWVMTVILWELFLEKAIFMYVLKGHAYCVLFGFLCLWGGTKATSEKNCHKANARKNTIVKMSKPCYRFFSLRSVSFGIDNWQVYGSQRTASSHFWDYLCVKMLHGKTNRGFY